ncbi:MAG TPA: hypothetical protein VLL05_14960, partial [Terriglobales bacterium]|nr:hypothetical protein [Terriglobales bacterium]
KIGLKIQPADPGKPTSRIKQLGESGRFAATNSEAEAKVSTRSPTERIRLLRAVRTIWAV